MCGSTAFSDLPLWYAEYDNQPRYFLKVALLAATEEVTTSTFSQFRFIPPVWRLDSSFDVMFLRLSSLSSLNIEIGNSMLAIRRSARRGSISIIDQADLMNCLIMSVDNVQSHSDDMTYKHDQGNCRIFIPTITTNRLLCANETSLSVYPNSRSQPQELFFYYYFCVHNFYRNSGQKKQNGRSKSRRLIKGVQQMFKSLGKS